MTEYIIEWSGIGARIVELIGSVHPCLIVKRLREERRREKIVRCRDCANYSGENDEIYPKWCMAMNVDGIEPDGFCAWGERGED